ncbi:MAG: hypothetical protein DRP76_04260, partial [Candidatus Omnitrophota bacterium]
MVLNLSQKKGDRNIPWKIEKVAKGRFKFIDYRKKGSSPISKESSGFSISMFSKKEAIITNNLLPNQNRDTSSPFTGKENLFVIVKGDK